jgi:hypothetical protein
MKGSAFPQESERWLTRAESLSEAIDEQIASLLEVVSSEPETQPLIDSDIGVERRAASGELLASALTQLRRPRSAETPTAPHPHRPPDTVSPALPGIVIAVPRPSDSVRLAFSLVTMLFGLLSITVGLIVYLT